MMRTALVVACVVAAAGCALRGRTNDAQRAADANTVAVHVFTEPRLNPAPLPDQVRRERAVRRLAGELADKKRLVVTDDPAQAQVLAEVKSAASVFAPNDPRAVFDPNAWTVELAGGGRKAQLTESTGFEDRTLNKLAGAVERWIEANRASIVGARAPGR